MSPPSFINTFLDSPILIGTRTRDFTAYASWLENPKDKVEKRSLNKFRAWKRISLSCELDILDPGMYPSLYNLLPRVSLEVLRGSPERLANRLSVLVSEALETYGTPPLDMGSEINMNDLPYWGQEAAQLLPFFRNFVDKLSRAKATGRSSLVTEKDDGWSLAGDEFTVMLSCRRRRIAYIGSYEQVLMWKDMLWGRFNVSLAIQVLYPGSSLPKDVGDCLDWCFKCIERYGNVGYELLKDIESLSKTSLVDKTDPIFGGAYTHAKMADVVRKKERSLSGSGTPLTESLLEILARNRTLPESVELFGLLKLSGHPCVDPSQGGRKVRKIACEPKRYKALNCARVRNNFCRMYTEGYVRRRSRWPPLNFPKHTRHTRLYQLYSLQETRLTVHSYPLEDWEGVTFKKHHDFEYYPNFTDLMDDKAISYYRDQIAMTWKRGATPRSNKRLLLEMLATPEISIRAIVEAVRLGKLPFEWFVVSLYPKEREFKLEPRMFAMMVFEMRAFFTATEANVADNIFPYLPPQTMTLSKQEIVERFHEMTWDPADTDKVRLYGEFDVESWNNNFQAPLVDPISTDIGDMHGEDNIFPVIHHFFTKCAVFVRVVDNKPEWIEEAQSPDFDLSSHSSNLLWTDHLAGVEGIAQKQWTAVTYSMIDLAMQKFPISYHLIGQADNQIFVALLDCTGQPDKEEYARRVAALIVEEVDNECHLVGHSTKKEECMLSSTVVTYSKDVYIRGVEYHTSLKALSRVFPNSSSDFPSIDNSLSALSSQCLAASEKMKNPLAAYRIWAFHASWYLVNLTYSEAVETSYLGSTSLQSLTIDTVLAILLLPSDLGGLGILPFTSLLYKGGGDPLSKSYASLALLSPVSKTARRLLSALQEGEWFIKQPDPATLLDDPYSLPLQRARTPEMAIQNEGLSAIRARVKNKDIQQLCTEKVDDYESELNRSLLLVRPFNPALLSDIKSDSVVGVRKQISKMFITTRTVQSLLQGQMEMNTCSAILNAGAGYAGATIRRMSVLRHKEYRPQSVYLEVEQMRSRWKLSDGAKITGITVHTPFDGLLTLHQSVEPTRGVKSLRTMPPTTDPMFSRGPNQPYLGRPTVEKRSVHGYRIVASSSPEKAVARLARIATQPGVGNEFEMLIANICLTRADVDFPTLITMLGRSYGGSIDHRYTSLMGQRGAGFMGGTAFPSQCVLSSDDAPPISGGAEDYPVMVQEWMVASLSFLYHSVRVKRDIRMACLNPESCNMSPIVDSVLTAPMKPLPGGMVFKTNSMVYADSILLKRLLSTGNSTLLSTMSPDDLMRSRDNHHLRKMIRSCLTGSRSAAAVADRGSGTIHLSLDLMELRGFGLRKVFEACSIEVARFAVESLYARSKGEMRWSPIPLILSLSEGLAKALAGTLVHKLFANDELVVSLGLISPVRYSVSGSTSTTKLRNFITDRATIAVTDPTSRLYSTPSCLFGDDKDGDAFQEVYSRIVLAYHQSILGGEIPLDQAYRVLRVSILEELRGLESEDQRLRRLEIIVGRLIVWAAKYSRDGFLESMTKLSRGQLILRCQMPVREAIREARSYPPPPGWTGQLDSPKFEPFMEAQELVSVTGSTLSSSPLVSPDWMIGISNHDIDMFSFSRLRGRWYGKESSVGYSYTGICDLCSGTVVLLVGCGYGSGAATLLLGGSSLVVGLDLDEDLDNQAVMAGCLVPPAVQHVGKANLFVRYPPGLPGGGNFFDNRVVQKCKEIAGPSAVVVVDIPLISRDRVLSLISSLSSYGTSVRFLVRVINSPESTAELIGGLEWCCNSIRWRIVHSTERMCESWICSEASGSMSVSPVTTTVPRLLPHKPVKSSALKCLGGGVSYLRNSLLSPLGLGDTRVADAYYERVTHLLAASIGEQEHRFTFKQWTEVLHAHVVSEVLVIPNPKGEVQSIKEGEEYYVQFGSHTIPVLATRDLLRLLTRILPRLLPAVD
ncbi:RNA-dependent RNA polymerase [Fusarium oxysporum mymonavirus 1]|uniref:RNA-directed RNA polymerase n=1 Tax=Fusarium oxysporum mymonavirus 1 TaxID=2928187 RepID=A0AAX3A794_9MONO|nr:RNA-dependent RNA polymerase [Fusarium oxysporum mymonavirus 1]UNQ75001.1 RNA-dependent RNA polymerase [Fusarium oxysporum mymonavirus 1]